MRPYVAIIDYGRGNLFSIGKACQHVNLRALVTSDQKEIENSCGIILPGVGAFGDAMDNLEKLGLIQVLKASIENGKPFLGICLGMQLLMSESNEFGLHKGLDAVKGSVLRFPARSLDNGRIKVPHVGWNRVYHQDQGGSGQERSTILKNVYNGAYMYFVHSYFVKLDSPVDTSVTTEYCGVTYCSGLVHRNIHAFQFHPEKSGPAGLEIYKNFRDIVVS